MPTGSTGPVGIVFLDASPPPGATNQVACLFADVGPFDPARSEVRELAVVFDQAAGCGVPLAIANMALVVEGPGQVASRQTWSVTYTFAP